MDSLVDEEDEEEEVEAEAGAEEDPADAAATRGAHARCRGCDAPLEQRCAARGARPPWRAVAGRAPRFCARVRCR